MKSNLVLAVVVVIGSTVYAAPAVQDNSKAAAFLSKFGYITSNDGADRLGDDEPPSEEDMKKAIKGYQTFMGLSETGKLDEETVKEMSKPRCGIKDQFQESDEDRFGIGDSRWKKKTLTYRISKYSSKMTKNEADNVIREAFNTWSQASPLRFVNKKSGPVHIDIRFEKGEHGDGDPFDGRGSTLAHAYYPLGGGDVHFDDDENWTLNFSGTNVKHTAIHELGHSLGLDHSRVRGAIMYPSYHPTTELHRDDIRGIQKLYPLNKG